MKKILGIMAKIVIVMVLIVILFLGYRYKDLIRTVMSIKKLSGAPAYQAKIYGDFGLDEYLKVGAKSNGELQDFCFRALKLEFLNPKAEKFDHGCSGFYAKTPDGDYILAINYDTYPDQQLPVVIQTDAKCSNSSVDNTKCTTKVLGIANSGYFVKNKELTGIVDKISIGASPYLCMDGMNEHGLGIGLATAKGSSGVKANDDRLVMVDFTISTAVLNQAKDVEETIDYLSQITIPRSTHPSHFLIGDAKGNSAVIEWIDGEMQVIETNEPYQIFSNTVLYRATEIGCGRYRAYEEVLRGTEGVISEEDALELLKENTLGAHACFSVVYNLSKGTMKVTFHNDYENVYEIAGDF
ncbi:MAG: linear amide C-N hydrolase [Lachnospiraceae bacterium]|nr:linear amide C-N hydrolase [Lachnospiraceae bacterium]